MSPGYKPNNPLLIKGTVVVVIVVAVAVLAFMGSGGLYQLAAVTLLRTASNFQYFVETSAIDVPVLFTPEQIHPEMDTQGYLLAVDFHQQVTGSFIVFSQLSKIASLLNLSIVEPYVIGTRLRGVPETHNDDQIQQALALGALYDVESIQSTLRSCGFINQLVPLKNITQKAYHNVIYVSFLPYKTKYSFPPEKIMETDNRMADMRYYNALKHWVALISGKIPSFILSHHLMVDSRPHDPVYLSNITRVLGSIIREEVAKHGPVTVVFGSWRGLHNTGGSHYFYYIPDYLYACSISTIDHSKAVIQAAKEFTQTRSKIRPVIGVHVRGERVLIDFKDNYKHCIEQLETLLLAITNSTKTTRHNVQVFHDLGKYGTASCHGQYSCRKSRTQFVSQIKQLGYPLVSFDPTKFNNFPHSPAFAAAVEQEYLSRVDILVTVGRGGFQQSIVDRFVKHSGKENLNRICISNN